MNRWILIAIVALALFLAEPKIENEVRKLTENKAWMKYYDALVVDTAARYGFDPNILRAIVRVESNWNPLAVSVDRQDVGLAGIRLGTIRLFIPEFKSIDDDTLRRMLQDPDTNLDIAGRVIAELTAHGLGASPALFHAYNIGETKYRKGTRSPFVARYVAAYDDYRGIA
jgi:soluble lytic murein transglycosylase-like protein